MATMIDIRRRQFMMGLGAMNAALMLLPLRAKATGAVPRVVALEYRYADHARSLGITPVGIADLGEYMRQSSTDVEALKAAATVDMGRRQEPSIEAIIQARPDLILGVHFRHDRIYKQLADIAPTELFQYTNTGKDDVDQLALMLQELQQIGEVTQRSLQAQQAIVTLEDKLAQRKEMLAARDVKGPVVFAHFPAGVNNIRLFTAQSLPIRLVERIGLEGGWSGASEGFGFSTIGPERLLGLADITFIGVSVGEDTSYTRLKKNPLWNALPFVRAGKFHVVEDIVWPFGGIPAADAFTQTVVDLLAPQ